VERAAEKYPEQYALTLEQMLENDYPLPSYLADTFQKPPGWVETPQPHDDSLLSQKKTQPKVYAIDCEMVRVLN
jgi:RNA exonuclease 1